MNVEQKAGNCFISSEGTTSIVRPIPGTDGVLDKYEFRCCELEENVIFEKGCVGPEDCCDLFNGYIRVKDAKRGYDRDRIRRRDNIKSVDLSGLDTSNTTDMRWMFYYNRGLRQIVIPINTSNVLQAGGMFTRCPLLQMPDVSSFDLGKAIDIDFADVFVECNRIPYSSWSQYQESKN